jgi:hypothetical protein
MERFTQSYQDRDALAVAVILKLSSDSTLIWWSETAAIITNCSTATKSRYFARNIITNIEIFAGKDYEEAVNMLLAAKYVGMYQDFWGRAHWADVEAAVEHYLRLYGRA